MTQTNDKKNDFVVRTNSLGAEVLGTRNSEVAYVSLSSEQSGLGGDQWKRQKAIQIARRVAKHLNRMATAKEYGYEAALNYYRKKQIAV